MTKVISKLLIVLVLACALFMTACEEEHVHAYVEEVLLEATCTEGGQVKFTCECGDTYVEDTNPAGHAYGEGKITLPTCVNEGYTEYVCSECNYVFHDTFVAANKDNHKYNLVDNKKPSCNEWGYEREVCEYCNNEVITNLEPVHDMSTVWVTVKQPTCSTPGEKRSYCLECAYFESIPLAPAHNYAEELDVIVEPTCTENGYTTHTCAGCGHQYKDTPVPALGHSWFVVAGDEWITSVVGNCSVEGEEYRKCEVCQTVERRSLGYVHSFTEEVTAPTCKIPGYTTFTCELCGHTEQGDYTAPEHTYGEWIIVTAATCKSYGLEKRECSECGLAEERITSPEHVYDNVSVIAPTTLTSGYTLHECDCGKGYKDEFISAFGTEGLTYTFRTDNEGNKVAVVTGYGTCEDTEIGIPSVYDGCAVVSIGNTAFYSNNNITAIYIPVSVVKFEVGAFWYCRNLTEFHYEGTISEWLEIWKPADWDKTLTSYTVYCSDGDITVGE